MSSCIIFRTFYEDTEGTVCRCLLNFHKVCSVKNQPNVKRNFKGKTHVYYFIIGASERDKLVPFRFYGYNSLRTENNLMSSKQLKNMFHFILHTAVATSIKLKLVDIKHQYNLYA